MRAIPNTVTRFERRSGNGPSAPCGVCGCVEIRTDEVFDRGLWRLAECRRCQSRWTEGPFTATGLTPQAAPARGTPESAAA
jgi:hypothetical protein